LDSKRIVKERFMQWCYYIIFFMGILPCLAQERSVTVLNELNSETAIAQWQVRRHSPPISMTLEKCSGTGSSLCTKLVLPPSKEWPAIILPTQNLKINHWEDYAFLCLDIDNPGISPVQLNLEVRCFRRIPIKWKRQIMVSPGYGTYRLALTEDVKSLPVTEIHLFADKPEVAREYRLSNLRLEKPSATEQLQEIISNRKEMVQILSDSLPYTGSEKTRGLLQQEVFKLASNIPFVNNEELEKERHRARKLMAQVLKFKQECIQENQIEALRRQETGSLLRYGWTNGCEKVFRQQPLRGKIGGTVEVELAQNEAEAVQLCLYSEQNIRNLQVKVSSLIGPNHAIFPASQIKIMPVGYVKTIQPCYFTEYIGWTPDPLLNYLPRFDIEKSMWQPVWIEASASANQPSGEYSGTISVTGDGITELNVPLTLKVWNFTLPNRGHFPLAINSGLGWECFVKTYASCTPEEIRQYEEYYRGRLARCNLPEKLRKVVDISTLYINEIRAHRLPYLDLYHSWPYTVEQIKARVEAGDNLICLFSIGDVTSNGLAKKHDEVMRLLASIAPYLEEQKLWDKVFIYGFDEAGPTLYPVMRSLCGAIKKKYPKLKFATTAYDSSFGVASGLDSAIDIWIPLTTKFSEGMPSVRKAQSRGREVWWYTCNYPTPPSANWLLENNAAATRLLMGFMPFAFNVNGFLHYSITRWKTRREISKSDGTVVTKEVLWNLKLRSGPLTDFDGKGFEDFNGDGFLFYPGENGPVPSMRLKLIRDGLEDYEYLWLLRDAWRRAEKGELKLGASWIKETHELLKTAENLCQSPSVYPERSEDILTVRRAIASMLEKANCGTDL